MAGFIHIIEYGSTLYVGMAREKMAAAYALYKSICSELCSRYSHKPFLNPTSDSRVFSSAKRLLALLETIAECHIGKSLNGPNRLSSFFLLLSFSQASSIITEAITMSQTRRSGIFYGYCTHTRVLSTNSKLFRSDSLALWS